MILLRHTPIYLNPKPLDILMQLGHKACQTEGKGEEECLLTRGGRRVFINKEGEERILRFFLDIILEICRKNSYLKVCWKL